MRGNGNGSGAASVTFRPSQVALIEPLPLIATFQRAEAECAAAFMVLAMRHRGDEWGAIRPPDCGAVLREFHDKKGYSWLLNPFCQPSFPELIERGFAEHAGEDTDKGQPIQFTAKGLAAMQKWVRS